jgi:hypothetical protein
MGLGCLGAFYDGVRWFFFELVVKFVMVGQLVLVDFLDSSLPDVISVLSRLYEERAARNWRRC